MGYMYMDRREYEEEKRKKQKKQEENANFTRNVEIFFHSLTPIKKREVKETLTHKSIEVDSKAKEKSEREKPGLEEEQDHIKFRRSQKIVSKILNKSYNDLIFSDPDLAVKHNKLCEQNTVETLIENLKWSLPQTAAEHSCQFAMILDKRVRDLSEQYQKLSKLRPDLTNPRLKLFKKLKKKHEKLVEKLNTLIHEKEKLSIILNASPAAYGNGTLQLRLAKVKKKDHFIANIVAEKVKTLPKPAVNKNVETRSKPSNKTSSTRTKGFPSGKNTKLKGGRGRGAGGWLIIAMSIKLQYELRKFVDKQAKKLENISKSLVNISYEVDAILNKLEEEQEIHSDLVSYIEKSPEISEKEAKKYLRCEDLFFEKTYPFFGREDAISNLKDILVEIFRDKNNMGFPFSDEGKIREEIKKNLEINKQKNVTQGPCVNKGGLHFNIRYFPSLYSSILITV